MPRGYVVMDGALRFFDVARRRHSIAMPALSSHVQTWIPELVKSRGSPVTPIAAAGSAARVRSAHPAPASGNTACYAGGGIVARRSTLALDADSPAIGAGNFLSNDPTDQRGRKRVSGLAPDSGACDLQTDAIFANGFDPD